ncbi:hypothetical protein JCM19992_26160 [Thermostilla marina]
MISLRIAAVEVENCGPWLGRRRVELPPAIGVWVADNETGKSTLLRVISAVLWGDTALTMNWHAASGSAFRGAVELSIVRKSGAEAREAFYRIERDFAANHVRAVKLGTTGGAKNAREVVEEVFDGAHSPSGRKAEHKKWPHRLLSIGVTCAPASFRHVAVLSQPLPDKLPRDVIESLLQGSGNQTAHEALSRLEERYREISKASGEAGLSDRNANNDRALEVARRKREKLASELREADAILARVETLRRERESLEKKLVALGEEIERLSGQLDRIGEYRVLKRQWTEAAEASRRLARVVDEVKRQEQILASIDDELVGLPAGLREASESELDEALKQLRRLETEVSQILSDEELELRFEKLKTEFADVWSWPNDAEERIDGYRRAVDAHREAELRAARLETEREKCRPTPDTARRLLVAGGVAATVCVVSGIVLGWWLGALWGILLGVLFGGCSAGATAYYYRPINVPEGHEAIERQYRECLAEQGRIADELRQARARCDFCESNDLDELYRLLDRWKEALRRRRELEQLQQENEERRRKTSVPEQPRPLREWIEHFGGIAKTIESVDKCRKKQSERRVVVEKITTALGTHECAKLDELELKLQSLEDRRTGLQSKMDSLVENSAMIEELKDVPADQLDARVAELTEKLRSKEGERKRLVDDLDTLRTELARAEAAAPLNLADGELQLRHLDAKIERMQRECEAIAQAGKLVKEASEQFSRCHREVIEREINDYMQAWTGRTARRFRVSNDFTVSLAVDGRTNSTVDPDIENLSQGTLDQLMLAVRLAVLDRVAEDIMLPLLIDDAFLTWDQERRGRLKSVLQRIAETRQILLVTHDASFQNWGNPVQMSEVF